ncbi:MAG: hypothetical protein IJR65_06100 [Oscillospiraceae bacterium]|nr:hypothetical protein [Oscillospiraceae bacterium]
MMKAELLRIGINAAASLAFIAVIVVALNWARHPGHGKRQKPTEKPPPPEQEETEAALKRSLKTMDRILIILGVFLFLFVVCMVVLFCLYQQTPDVLIGSVFGAATGEISAMAAIKRNKDRLRKELRKAQGKDHTEEESEEAEQ